MKTKISQATRGRDGLRLALLLAACNPILFIRPQGEEPSKRCNVERAVGRNRS